MFKGLVASLVLAAGLVPTGEEPAKDVAKKYAEGDLAAFVQSCKQLKAELKAANEARKDWEAYSEDWKKWNQEEADKHPKSFTAAEFQWSSKKDKSFRATCTDTEAAKKLKEFQANSGGVVAEFFVTCAKGGNVCQSQVTSDWFQGDEDKFTKVEGKTDYYYAEPKRDDTVGKVGVQVSIPIMDDDGKTFIGVAVVTVVTDNVK